MLASLPLVSWAIIIFAVGVALIAFLKSWRWTAAAILICVVVPITLSGFWVSGGNWGISDWDFYFTTHTIYRNTILQFHQFPLWNPYTCGGTASLADPEFSVLTPTFLLELILGVPMGVRVAIFLATTVGALGMVWLVKKLKLPVEAGLLAALGYAFSGVKLLEIVEGHVNIFAAMWIPWIIGAWLLSYRDKKRTLWCGIFLALTFLQGGIYLLMYTGIVFLVLPLLTKDRKRAFLVSLKSILWAIGLAGFKIIPVFLWLHQFQKQTYSSSTYTLAYLYDILLGRYPHGANVLPNQGGGWHEYGAYIGPVIIMMAIAGLMLTWRQWRTRAIAIAVVLSLLLSSAGPILKPFYDVAKFLPRSDISRIALMSVIGLCLLAAIGMSKLRLTTKTGKLLASIILIAAAVDLMTYANMLSQEAFIVPPVVPLPTQAQPPLEFDTRDLKTRVNGEDFSRSYALTLTGYGTMNYCTPLGPDPSVRTIYDEGDHSAMSILKQQGTISSFQWTPNHVTVSGTATHDTSVVLNTNFVPGWWANNKPATNQGAHPAAPVPAGPFSVTLTYKPPGLLMGIFLSIVSVLVALVTVFRKKHESKK